MRTAIYCIELLQFEFLKQDLKDELLAGNTLLERVRYRDEVHNIQSLAEGDTACDPAHS